MPKLDKEKQNEYNRSNYKNKHISTNTLGPTSPPTEILNYSIPKDRVAIVIVPYPTI